MIDKDEPEVQALFMIIAAACTGVYAKNIMLGVGVLCALIVISRSNMHR